MTASWNEVRQALAVRVSDMDYRVWLAPVDGELADRTVRLRLAGGSGYMAERLERKMGALIRETAAPELGCAPSEVVLDIRLADARKPGLLPSFETGAAQAPSHAPSQTAQHLAKPRRGKTLSVSADSRAAACESAPADRPEPPASARDCRPAGKAAADRPFAATVTSVSPVGTRATWQMSALPLVRTMPLDSHITASGARLKARVAEINEKWRYSFDDFVVGDSNRMAATAARDMCRPDSYAETLFVSSDTGLGKTHIVQSAVRELLNTRGTDARVAYLTADEFYSRYRLALSSNDLDGFQEKVRSLDFLLMEDVQFLVRKTMTQEILLGLVKHLRNKGSKVVFTSRYRTNELKDIDPALVSFLGAGLQTVMDAPDYEMRCEIVRRKARAANIPLSEEVVDILASSLEGDVRRIESCLQTIFLKARVDGHRPDPDLAREVVEGLVEKREDEPRIVSFDLLLSHTCKCCGLTEGQLCSPVRKRPHVEARNVLFYLARNHAHLTYEQIGARVNRTHSTVIKGITTIEHKLTLDTPAARQTAHLVELIEKNAGLASSRLSSDASGPSDGSSGRPSSRPSSRPSRKSSRKSSGKSSGK